MSAPFEVIDDTADIGIIARGRDLSGLFANAAAGMLYLMAGEDFSNPTVHRKLELQADDAEALLVEWLNELLYILDTERLLLNKFDIAVSGNRLEAKCAWEKLEVRRHRLKREIKAATYHDLRVEKANGEYVARIIFDI